ncbi:hypothetical protein [Halorussus salinus]|uniref:hypothetical protein n=1 Tax=Halorussus salinus TaxID=1364935 RepID=UPI001091EFE8|nr:hypothetical protein [Halorussus salinus]
MTEERPLDPRSAGSRRTGASATRRGVLALAATTALAGCNAVDSDLLDGDIRSSDPPTLDSAALRDLAAADPPSVPRTAPVEIPDSYVEKGVARARDLLGSVPAPFDADEIPNGAIRRRLGDRYDRADESVAAVGDAESLLETTADLRHAREEARAVAAAWRAIDGDLTLDAVRASGEELWAALNRFRYRWDYLGTDPVAALVVHAVVEKRLRTATLYVERAVGRRQTTRDDALAVGERAGHLESARAALADAALVYEPFQKSRDSRSVRSGFVRAVEALASFVGDRRRRLPDGDPQTPSSYVTGDVNETPVGYAIGELARELSFSSELRERDPDRYATSLLAGYGRLTRLRAFESLRERVAADEHVTVESAADARALRQRAVEAISSGRERATHPHLNRWELSTAASVVRYADDRLGRLRDDESVDADSVARELGEYVRAAAVARAVPETSEDVASLVRRSVGAGSGTDP